MAVRATLPPVRAGLSPSDGLVFSMGPATVNLLSFDADDPSRHWHSDDARRAEHLHFCWRRWLSANWVFGTVADRYGRRAPFVLLSLATYVIGALLAMSASSLALFSALGRVVQAFGFGCFQASSCVAR